VPRDVRCAGIAYGCARLKLDRCKKCGFVSYMMLTEKIVCELDKASNCQHMLSFVIVVDCVCLWWRGW